MQINLPLNTWKFMIKTRKHIFYKIKYKNISILYQDIKMKEIIYNFLTKQLIEMMKFEFKQRC